MIKYDKELGSKSDISIALVDFMDHACLTKKEKEFVLKEALKIIKLRK